MVSKINRPIQPSNVSLTKCSHLPDRKGGVNPCPLGEGAKKKGKKLTSVSFAFTYTYTLLKN